MTSWYVAQTHARAEDKAAWHLRRQGFNVYLPRYLKRRRHARRTNWVRTPLFPRYLFVEMDPAHMQWRCINSTIGVSQLLCHGDAPAPVPAGVVEQIEARQDEGGVVRLDRIMPFKKGDQVQITGGAMCDRIGLFECMTDEDRVTLLFDLLGRQVRIEIPLASVEAYA